MRQALLRRMGAVVVALGLATTMLPEEAQAVLLFSTSSPGWGVSTDFDVNIGPDVAQVAPVLPGDPDFGWAQQDGISWITPAEFASDGQALDAPAGSYTYGFGNIDFPLGLYTFTWFADNAVTNLTVCFESPVPQRCLFAVVPQEGSQNVLSTLNLNFTDRKLGSIGFNVSNDPSAAFNPTGLNARVDVTPIPEASALALFGVGAAGLLCLRRRHERQR
jgi:hypothetical protein